MANFRAVISLLVSQFLLCILVTAQNDKVEFCHPDAASSPDLSSSFCMSLATYRNLSSNERDTYFTLTVPRANGDARGWTAVGLGSESKFLSLHHSLFDVIFRADDFLFSERSPHVHHIRRPQIVQPTHIFSSHSIRLHPTRGPHLSLQQRLCSPHILHMAATFQDFQPLPINLPSKRLFRLFRVLEVDWK